MRNNTGHRTEWEKTEMTQNKRRDSRVAVVACGSYDDAAVRKAMTESISLMGGWKQLLQGAKTVAVKLNLVGAHEPEEAATVHPSVVRELIREIVAAGSQKVVLGDSPGGAFTAGHLKQVYETCGLVALVKELDADPEMCGRVLLNYNTEIKDAKYGNAVSIQQFQYTAWLDEADVIINLCKLKTHASMKLTCATKNLFGTIPGLTKPQYHVRFPESARFANMLIDLNEYFRPVVNLADAVFCMEGNGPSRGTPRKMGALLASPDPYALDIVAGYLIGYSLTDLPVQMEAYKRRLGPGSVKEVSVIPDPQILERLRIPDFQKCTKEKSVLFRLGPVSQAAGKLIRRIFTTRPNVEPSECIGCGHCAEQCPVHAIAMMADGKKKYPEIDRNVCIRCFCCQEFCPVGAMKVQKVVFSRLGKAGKHKA